MNRRLFSLTAAAAAALLSLAAPAALAQTKWDLPAGYPATNFHTVNLVDFANDIDKATGGKLKITVHANGALFKAPEIKRAVQGGQAQAGEILMANFQNEWQLFGVDALPFLADSYDEAMKLYKVQKPFLEKKLAEQGMALLYAVPWPPQGIYVKKPINSGADLKGVKWRAYSPSTARIAELVGAQPVTVQAAELSQAMATGVVESYMSSGSTGFDTKTYEHIKYWYDTQAWLPKNGRASTPNSCHSFWKLAIKISPAWACPPCTARLISGALNRAPLACTVILSLPPVALSMSLAKSFRLTVWKLVAG